MDLRELSCFYSIKHPWETARLKAIKRILHSHLYDGINVLDIGCGDGFVSRMLFENTTNNEITAVDINLTNKQILELSYMSKNINYTRKIPDTGYFNLLLLLDVIEHVDNETEMISKLTINCLKHNGKVLITVPAHQFLYSNHDKYLGHFRRYSLKNLESVAKASGLTVISSGYLFSSLLVAKCLVYKLFNSKSIDGVGHWNRGKFLTYIIDKILTIDNNILISLCKYGIKMPGLSGWVLCEKP